MRNENAFANQVFGDRSYTAVDFSNNIFSSNISVASVNTNVVTNNITVDEIGNMLSYKDATFQWNGRQLSSISGQGMVLSYEYNMDGQRVKKTLSATTGEVGYTYEYFYCGDILAGEIFTPNQELMDAEPYVITYMFDESGDYFGFTYNGTPYYYVKNLQNDVYLIIDENGVAQVLYQYDAWGNIVGGYDASTDGLGAVNPITYRSYHYEHDTGYYFLTTRYYSPELHRFISSDTADILGVQGNLYDKSLFSYCDNNPVVRIDISGYAWETVFDIVSLCMSVADVATNPADVWAWFGLACDFLDLIPYVSGLGESVKAYKASVEIANATTDTARATKVITETTSTSIPYLRRKAVNDAWKNEYNDVVTGGKGITRTWLPEEIDELLKTGKVAGYEGHHIISVNNEISTPALVGDFRNIQFLPRADHLAAHNGSWQNPTSTFYNPR